MESLIRVSTLIKRPVMITRLFSLLSLFILAASANSAYAQGTCATAAPFCTGTTYTFPNSTGTSAPSGPYYDCLSSRPNPVWYYLQISNPGNIQITVSQTNGSGSGIDVDFIVWGPFTSPTAPCLSGLTSGTVVDCSYSANSTEIVDIPNAQTGQYYLFLLTNYSNQSGTITFSQTAGAGATNCAVLCGVSGFTATPSACNSGTNTYSVSGTLTISNPPTTGTLVISNSCGGSQTFNAPFGTSINYNFTGLSPGSGSCTVSATFSADATCNSTVNYNRPAPCPLPCSISSVTATPAACNPANNTYSLSGAVTFTNPPSSGTLTVSSSCGGTQTFNAPFTSPLSYNLTGLTANGAACTVTASFSAASCSNTATYTAPVCPCSISGVTATPSSCNPANNTYSVSGAVTFANPPSSGTLTVSSSCGGTQTFNAPFTSPLNYNLTGLTPNGTACTVTASFSATTCTGTGNYTSPASCACPADAGTASASMSGDGQNNYVLCYGDEFTLSSNNDFVLPPDVGPLNGSAYNPGLGYLIYSCPPTAGAEPLNDPCYQGIHSTGNTMVDPNDMFVVENYPPGTFTNNTVYYVPFTFYNTDDFVYNVNCFAAGTPTAVTYLPEITTSASEDCMAGTVSVTVSGGRPAVLGGDFTASGLSPANASFATTTVGNGGTIVINGLTHGQNYSFTLTDANGCPHTFSGGPFTGPQPSVITAAGPFCESDSPVNLSGTPAGGTWSGTGITDPALGTFDPSVAGIGGHSITYTAPGCYLPGQVTVTVTPLIEATINPVGPFCTADAPVTLSAANPGGTWAGPGITNASTGTFDPAAAGAGTHTITYTTAGSCGEQQTTSIQVIQNANAAINPAGPFCVSDAPVNLTAVQPGGTWSGTGITDASAGTFSPAVAGVGSHTLTYTLSGQCGDAQNLLVTVHDLLPLAITPVGPFCTSDSPVTLTAATSGGTWSGTGITNPSTGVFNPSVAGPGNHTITYTLSSNCGGTSTTSIRVGAAPATVFVADQLSGCAPLQVNFTNQNPESGAVYAWFVNGHALSGDPAGFTHSFTAPGCYDISLQAVSAEGCSASTTQSSMICVYTNPIAAFSYNPQHPSVFTPELTFVNNSVGASSYHWDFSGYGTSTEVNPVFQFPASDVNAYLVCLMAASGQGCADTVCQVITFEEELLVYVPNTFTPDGDGMNDIFLPIVSGHDPSQYDFYVFNRWGELVFHAGSERTGWDGTFQGKAAKQETYAWRLVLKKASNGDKKEFFGHVNLVR